MYIYVYTAVTELCCYNYICYIYATMCWWSAVVCCKYTWYMVDIQRDSFDCGSIFRNFLFYLENLKEFRYLLHAPEVCCSCIVVFSTLAHTPPSANWRKNHWHVLAIILHYYYVDYYDHNKNDLKKNCIRWYCEYYQTIFSFFIPDNRSKFKYESKVTGKTQIS